MKKWVNILWIIISFAATVILAITLIIPHTPPQSSLNIFSSLNILFPYALILSIICAITCLLRKQFYTFIWSLIVLILSIPNTFNHISFSYNNNDVDNNAIKVCSYNVHYFNFYENHNNDALIFLKQSDADVLCLQEIMVMTENDHTLADLKKELSNYPYHHIEFIHKGNKSCKGIATFSKYPIVKRGKASFQSDAHGAISSWIAVNNDTLQVINCYLESNRLTREEKEIYASAEKTNILKRIYNKLAQASQKRGIQAQAVVSIKDNQCPTLVCGDLNDVPTSYVYRTIKGNDQDCFLALDWGIGNTFHEGLYHFRIDYIFADEHIEPLSFKVNKQPYSDHYPIELHCKIK
jgi:endonuclease/exonuclease/phosphatase family metal-dependent hydrolase